MFVVSPSLLHSFLFTIEGCLFRSQNLLFSNCAGVRHEFLFHNNVFFCEKISNISERYTKVYMGLKPFYFLLSLIFKAFPDLFLGENYLARPGFTID